MGADADTLAVGRRSSEIGNAAVGARADEYAVNREIRHRLAGFEARVLHG